MPYSPVELLIVAAALGAYLAYLLPRVVRDILSEPHRDDHGSTAP